MNVLLLVYKLVCWFKINDLVNSNFINEVVNEYICIKYYVNL